MYNLPLEVQIQILSHISTTDYYSVKKSFRNSLPLLHEVTFTVGISQTFPCSIRTQWTMQKLNLIKYRGVKLRYIIRDIPEKLMGFFVTTFVEVFEPIDFLEINKRIPIDSYDYLLFEYGCKAGVYLNTNTSVPFPVLSRTLQNTHHLSIIQNLVQNEMLNPGNMQTYLYLQIEQGNLEIIQLCECFLMHNRIADYLTRSIAYQHVDCVKFFLKHPYEREALELAFEQAIRIFSRQIIDLILEKGISINYKNCFLLRTIATDVVLFEHYLNYPNVKVCGSVVMAIFNHSELVQKVLNHRNLELDKIDEIVSRAITDKKLWILKHPKVLEHWKTINCI
jgi:hypothetical protein